MLIGFGVPEAILALRMDSWDRLAYIVYADVIYLVLQAGALIAYASAGIGLLLGNIVLAITSMAMLTLLLAIWVTHRR
jgi:hypothetical protein